jgi:hypothetical protein
VDSNIFSTFVITKNKNMKNLIYLLIFTISLGFISCKKNSPTPDPAPQNTTPPTPTDTTGNDTTSTANKVKVFYSLNIKSLKTSVSDYVHDTTNVRIYHNTTQLRNHYVSYNPVDVTLGLDVIENCPISYGFTYTPVYANHGDSIVIVFDHLEYNLTAVPSANENFLRTTCKFYNENLVQQQQQYSVPVQPFVDISTYPTASDPFIGYGVGLYTSYYWQLGGQYRIVYHIP